jgi:hypothetical protein
MWKQDDEHEDAVVPVQHATGASEEEQRDYYIMVKTPQENGKGTPDSSLCISPSRWVNLPWNVHMVMLFVGMLMYLEYLEQKLFLFS